MKDLAVDRRRHFRGDGDIVVVDHIVGQLCDLKKVGADPDRPATGAKAGSANVGDNVSRRSDGRSHCRMSWFGVKGKRLMSCWM